MVKIGHDFKRLKIKFLTNNGFKMAFIRNGSQFKILCKVFFDCKILTSKHKFKNVFHFISVFEKKNRFLRNWQHCQMSFDQFLL